MAVEIVVPCADVASAWAAADALARLEPWCLEVEDTTAYALFGRAPAGLDPAWRIDDHPRAARYGSTWHDAHRATQVGPLWVISTGRRAPTGAKHVLVVDALKAFGAGTHETTMLCLERVVELSPMSDVLDVGTGSGILAIAALELGAAGATGIDIDAGVLAETAKNAARNGAARLKLTLDPVAALGRRFPVVLANVRTPALIAMAPALVEAATDALVLSGIRVEERDEIVPVYLERGARLLGEAVRGDWMRLDLAPPPTSR